MAASASASIQVSTVIAQTTFRTLMINSTDYIDKDVHPDRHTKMTVNAYASNGIIDFNIITDSQAEPGNDYSGHPFAHCRAVRATDGRSWIIDSVVDNSLMRELIRYIAMSDEDIERVCGTTLRSFYRAELLRILETVCLGE